MEMQKMDFKKVRPSDYLKNGFFDQSGDWIEGLNGFYSVTTAHLLREEGTSPRKSKNDRRSINGFESGSIGR